MSRSGAIRAFLLIVILVVLLIWIAVPGEEETFVISEIPELKGTELIISREGFTISFDTVTRQARWVAWELTRDELTGESERTDRFRADPLLSGFTDMATSYTRSGYDRGHLAPAADMTWSDSAMMHSFYYSNISPQNPRLNRGLWKKTEEMARKIAFRDGSVLIITGPIFNSSDTVFLNSTLPVPDSFFKVLAVSHDSGIECIGFLFPNDDPGNDLFAYTVTVDSVESVTGLNFFPALPPKTERAVESTYRINIWQ